jgi:homoserine kinase
VTRAARRILAAHRVREERVVNLLRIAVLLLAALVAAPAWSQA